MNQVKVASRKELGLKLKALREARLISQSDLAKRLEISQAGLSKIERGVSSLNTEDFLEVLRIFNVPASHFYPNQSEGSSGAALQNALTRLGATHLLESALLPSEDLEHASQVIREVLIDGQNPRQITALAPVIVAQIDRLHLPKLWAEFSNLQLERRLGWVFENTFEALKQVPKPTDLPTSRNHLKARTVIHHFLGSLAIPPSDRAEPLLRDILGTIARSNRTQSSLERQSSTVSEKWHILSPIQVKDFADALHASQNAS